jgi:hypothetical protein
VVLLWELVDICKTADTKIVLFCQDFGVFADIALAFVALDLIGGVDYVLSRIDGT